MQGARVFVAVEPEEPRPLRKAQGAQPFATGLTALIRLDDHVNGRDAIEQRGPLFTPALSAGEPDSGNLIMPECMTIALPLNDYNGAGPLRILQPPEAI